MENNLTSNSLLLSYLLLKFSENFQKGGFQIIHIYYNKYMFYHLCVFIVTKKIKVVFSIKVLVTLGRPHHFKFFKGSLPQILLGQFLHT